MVRQHKTVVTIQAGGRVEIPCSDLPEGQQAEVDVRVMSEPQAKDYLALFGTGRGGFTSAEEADRFLRNEREARKRNFLRLSTILNRLADIVLIVLAALLYWALRLPVVYIILGLLAGYGLKTLAQNLGQALSRRWCLITNTTTE